ncbi:hypothetical protein M3Y97_00192600 [Aphelenchoides bicaudatus]|nr:hypothetical protein M3Y97_00192600 [Aphelenchoides bicaudatus]
MSVDLQKCIEKMGNVFKLKISLCNVDLKIARLDGDLKRVSKMYEKQTNLAASFRKWKHAIKKSHVNVEFTEEVIQKLQYKAQHADKEAERICDLIEREECNLKKKINDLPESANGDKSTGSRNRYAAQERTDIKYPLNHDEYSARMNTSIEDHLKSARSFSRFDLTSELRTNITDQQSDKDPLFSINWDDFTSYFLLESRKQHEADRIIEKTIFNFVEYYWKAVEKFVRDGLLVPKSYRSNWNAQSQWVQKRLSKLDGIAFKPYPLPSKIEDLMRKYIRLINDIVVEIIRQNLRAGLFDAFRTTKVSEFCAEPTLDRLKEIVIDEITKDYGMFNNRQADVAPENSTPFERSRNEPSSAFCKWMLRNVRVQHEIARQHKIV